MSTGSPLVYRLAAAAEVEKLIVDGLRIKVLALALNRVELEFTLVDSDGRDLSAIGNASLPAGTHVTLTGIGRALTVVVGP